MHSPVHEGGQVAHPHEDCTNEAVPTALRTIISLNVPSTRLALGYPSRPTALPRSPVSIHGPANKAWRTKNRTSSAESNRRRNDPCGRHSVQSIRDVNNGAVRMHMPSNLDRSQYAGRRSLQGYSNVLDRAWWNPRPLDFLRNATRGRCVETGHARTGRITRRMYGVDEIGPRGADLAVISGSGHTSKRTSVPSTVRGALDLEESGCLAWIVQADGLEATSAHQVPEMRRNSIPAGGWQPSAPNSGRCHENGHAKSDQGEAQWLGSFYGRDWPSWNDLPVQYPEWADVQALQCCFPRPCWTCAKLDVSHERGGLEPMMYHSYAIGEME
ncbi:uncharacterized protein N7482_003469 [Penicillium canariense]|uniref:Uncharacterized protein n=1 Tax=Penicillium canariense TaxID=189055 RepID=A0A9W9LPC3_9EURO|nr:uncharacterized protein N7482_003469 [Penicillium canariense]KAJ5167875.1 hypothetical protein N7482_003469 [Penicillium canariense]